MPPKRRRAAKKPATRTFPQSTNGVDNSSDDEESVGESGQRKRVAKGPVDGSTGRRVDGSTGRRVDEFSDSDDDESGGDTADGGPDQFEEDEDYDEEDDESVDKDDEDYDEENTEENDNEYDESGEQDDEEDECKEFMEIGNLKRFIDSEAHRF